MMSAGLENDLRQGTEDCRSETSGAELEVRALSTSDSLASTRSSSSSSVKGSPKARVEKGVFPLHAGGATSYITLMAMRQAKARRGAASCPLVRAGRPKNMWPRHGMAKGACGGNLAWSPSVHDWGEHECRQAAQGQLIWLQGGARPGVLSCCRWQHSKAHDAGPDKGCASMYTSFWLPHVQRVTVGCRVCPSLPLDNCSTALSMTDLKAGRARLFGRYRAIQGPLLGHGTSQEPS